MAPHVSLIVPACDGVSQTLRCLIRIAELPETHAFEVVIVDDGTTDGTASLLAGLEGDLHVHTNPEPRGFGAACDQGVELARADTVVLVSQHALPCAGWLAELVAALDSADTVLPRSVDRRARFLPDAHWLVLAVARAAYRQVGGFAGSARPGQAEKSSLLDCLRAAGHRAVMAPGAVVLEA
jgi:glycosyltransferase involved in cell wall biosynthesis